MRGEPFISSDEQSAFLNAFHGGLDCSITRLHGALALEIDYSPQSFKGLGAILLPVMEEGSSENG